MGTTPAAFYVQPGANVALTALTLTNGNADRTGGGGGIFNRGEMAVNQSTLAGNRANSGFGGGGGIVNNNNIGGTL